MDETQAWSSLQRTSQAQPSVTSNQVQQPGNPAAATLTYPLHNLAQASAWANLQPALTTILGQQAASNYLSSIATSAPHLLNQFSALQQALQQGIEANAAAQEQPTDVQQPALEVDMTMQLGAEALQAAAEHGTVAYAAPDLQLVPGPDAAKPVSDLGGDQVVATAASPEDGGAPPSKRAKMDDNSSASAGSVLMKVSLDSPAGQPLLLAFGDSFDIMTWYVETKDNQAVPAGPEIVAALPPFHDIKTVGVVKQVLDHLEPATVAEMQAYFRQVFTHEKGAQLEPVPTCFISITCDKSKGFITYELDKGSEIVNPIVVYEDASSGGKLVEITPAQFESLVAMCSAKKWRASFKATGFYKISKNGLLSVVSVGDVVTVIKQALGLPATATPGASKKLPIDAIRRSSGPFDLSGDGKRPQARPLSANRPMIPRAPTSTATVAKAGGQRYIAIPVGPVGVGIDSSQGINIGAALSAAQIEAIQLVVATADGAKLAAAVEGIIKGLADVESAVAAAVAAVQGGGSVLQDTGIVPVSAAQPEVAAMDMAAMSAPMEAAPVPIETTSMPLDTTMDQSLLAEPVLGPTE